MKKTKIDWCDSTWNPVTGCFHRCGYCYARDIARRFGGASETHNNETCHECQWITEAEGEIHELVEPIYDCDKGRKAPYPYDFDPTFHKYRLNEYQNKKGRNIFVCSMADLFGEWVPDSWIKEVFAACDRAPQHSYLFLTKNPDRYITLDMREKLPHRKNMWYGMTVTNAEQAEVANIILGDMTSEAGAFLSVEPMLEDVTERLEDTISNFADWVIVGAETGRRRNKVVPERVWIEKLLAECRKYDIPIFMKSSLADIWREPLIQEFPEGLRR